MTDSFGTDTATGRVSAFLRSPGARALASLAVIVLLGMIFNADGAFFKWGTHRDMLRQVSVYGILACGMTLVIITSGIDLSVGSLIERRASSQASGPGSALRLSTTRVCPQSWIRGPFSPSATARRFHCPSGQAATTAATVVDRGASCASRARMRGRPPVSCVGSSTGGRLCQTGVLHETANT